MSKKSELKETSSSQLDDTTYDEPRIGVYISHTVDVDVVADYAANLDNVVVSRTNKYMCSDPGQDVIKKDIEELNLNRVVVASCTPLMHEETFRRACAESGLNPFLFQMANIREHCSWVTTDITKATEKAKRLVTAAVQRVQNHIPLKAREVTVNPDTLVVGGGIAGMETALKIANAGKKVYLVEREPSIGGHMAKFDKTFPTLDCAACILTPKMVEVARNPNIELLTYSEVQDCSGYVGNFKVKVKKKSRYVDENTCTGCAECIKNCPIDIKDDFNEGLSTRKAIYRPFPQAVPSVFAIDKTGVPPCRNACPAGVNAFGYISLIGQKKYHEALDLVRQSIPLPAVCGRVCFHPCEEACERGKVDEPIAINYLKRFIADYELKNPRKIEEIPKTHEEKIAVIGSGPAGLAAAWELTKKGFPVTIFEELPKPGGLLRYGIPEYRLPKKILDAEIKYLQKQGVEIQTNTRIGKDLTLTQLQEQGYKAFVIAIGAWTSRKMNIPGENLKGVMHALYMLRDVTLGKIPKITGKVAVIGGGNAAVDAARTALRLGASETHIIYRRSRAEMPAIPWEIAEAEKEGIKISLLATPTEILGKNGKVIGLKCIKMKLGEPDEDGRRRPVPIKDSEFQLDFDNVIIAIGQSPDPSLIENEFKLDKWGCIPTDNLTLQTEKPSIYAGGDVVTGPATVIDAFAMGREAGVSIARYITGQDLHEGREKRLPVAKDVPLEGVAKEPRVKMPHMELAKRERNFDEVELGITEKMALLEASRCLECSHCCECRECEKLCEVNCIHHDMTDQIVELDVGAVVLATGYQPYDATKLTQYGYGKYPNVITSMEFERLSHASGPTGGKILLKNNQPPKSVGIIHCAGSRDEHHNEYCSSVCCMYSLKIAHLVKEKTNADVYNFYIDLRTPQKNYEEFYKRILNEDVNFIRGRAGQITAVPKNEKEEGKLVIQCEDTLLGFSRRVPVDMVILSIGITPPTKSNEIQRIFGVQRGPNGFFTEQHPKLAPVNTHTAGIFLAGTCQGPKDIPDTVAQAGAAAASVIAMGAKGVLLIEPNKALLDIEKCSNCQVCVSTCNYSAITPSETGENHVDINEVLCQGCGSCVAACPSAAITQEGFTDQQIYSEIKALIS